MTLKQILRRAPKEAVCLYYNGETCEFFGIGTYFFKTESSWPKFDYTTSYREKRFLASKINGKWIPNSVLSDSQIKSILDAAQTYDANHPCGLEDVVHRIVALLRE